MSTQSNRKVWQSPWGYTESVAVVAGVAIIGAILQLTIGSFDFYLLSNPVNLITGLVFFVLSVLLGVSTVHSSFARWLSSVELSVSLIVAILTLTIIMGLTPQIAEGEHTHMALGFDSMTRNWSFVLLYGLTIISLGTLIIARVRRFRIKKDTPFVLQHFGLWLTLVASGLGYADMERYVMYVQEGETQWRVYDASGEVIELPIAIKLNDFDMEVYPPRLAVVDRESGSVQGVEPDVPQYFQIDPDVTKASIAGWEITTHEYIHKAVRGADSTYREVPMPGSTPAVKITARRGDQLREGWVCGGNQVQVYMSLPLSEQLSVVMTPADPREFVSDVEVYTKEGDVVGGLVRVNHPLNVGVWNIYQYGYDNAAGALSSYSSFELVYDAWLLPVYVGLVLMVIGAISMVLLGRNRKIKKYDLE